MGDTLHSKQSSFVYTALLAQCIFMTRTATTQEKYNSAKIVQTLDLQPLGDKHARSSD